MTSIQAAGLWIGLNTVFLIYVSVRVGMTRTRLKINLGDGGNEEMVRAIRAQGNYVEYAPIALLGLFALAVMGQAPLLIHALGAAFLAARVAHLLGLGAGVWPAGRFIGTLGTMLSLLVTAGALLRAAFG
ncbi:MAG: MAPEG family protein [Parvularculaceae bacterium]